MMTNSNKIRVAFIKFGGMSSGGTEKFLQQIAANLPSDRYDVDFYYTNAAPYVGSDYKHLDTSKERLEYMSKSQVRLIEVKVGQKDITHPQHTWLDTNFWELFDESKYDIVQMGRAGHSEYPFCKIHNVPLIDSIHLGGHLDKQANIVKTFHINKENAKKWVGLGGDASRVEIISLPLDVPSNLDDINSLRTALGLSEEVFVYGLHQRDNDGIFSPWALQAYSDIEKVEGDKVAFVLLGGSNLYVQQAKHLGLKHFHHIEFDSSMTKVWSFLKTLNVYAHDRADGEVNSQAIAEAMACGLPVISHFGKNNNGHVEVVEKKAGFVHGHFDSYVFDLHNMFLNPDYYKWFRLRVLDRFIELYDFNSQMKSITKVYEEVFEKSNTNFYGLKSNLSQEESWIDEWMNE
jgi:glycosyltransferase involved in cell wall biosynthesis